jgi:peptidoglycan/LPS O-acetylase OafA/YrhL
MERDGEMDQQVTDATLRRQAQTFGEAFENRENNFNLIRMLAALSVLYSHCFPLAGINSWEPFSYFLGDYDTGGGWGVAIFFVISGFLVTRSVLQHSVTEYFISRAVRIIPGLALVTLLSVFIIGPLLTKNTLSEYFSSVMTWDYLHNVTVFNISYRLPGVFSANPEISVNGSLWTLPIECGIYVILPLIAVFGLLQLRTVPLMLAIIVFCYVAVVAWWHLDWSNQGGSLFRGAPLYSTMKSAIFFFAGTWLWILRDRVPYSHGIAIAMALLLYLFAAQPLRAVAFHIAIPYLVIYAALTRNRFLYRYNALGDYSYGTYIFAFPVQQSIVAISGPSIGPNSLVLLSGAITIAVSFVSWHTIEKPCLALRRKLSIRSPHATHGVS